MDSENVIKGLNDIGGFITRRVGFEQARNFLRTIDDAIALLNEQEAVEPVFECEEPTLKLGQFHCGNCHTSFGISHYNFCPFCGKPVKWNERPV